MAVTFVRLRGLIYPVGKLAHKGKFFPGELRVVGGVEVNVVLVLLLLLLSLVLHVVEALLLLEGELREGLKEKQVLFVKLIVRADPREQLIDQLERQGRQNRLDHAVHGSDHFLVLALLALPDKVHSAFIKHALPVAGHELQNRGATLDDLGVRPFAENGVEHLVGPEPLGHEGGRHVARLLEVVVVGIHAVLVPIAVHLALVGAHYPLYHGANVAEAL